MSCLKTSKLRNPAAGVGKPYAMLEAAHLRKGQGVDVVIDCVETHKRPDTEELVGGLEAPPRKQVDYHKVTMTELDVDPVQKRRPQLIRMENLPTPTRPVRTIPNGFWTWRKSSTRALTCRPL